MGTKQVEKLTALQVSEAKYRESRSASGALKGNRLSDGAGLYLYITPNGAKSFRFYYRSPVHDGKNRVLVYGSMQDMSLKQARAEHQADRLLLTKGLDPADERDKQHRERQVAALTEKNQAKNTFEVVAAEWLKAELKAKPRSAVWKSNIERWIGWANEEFGNRPLPEIEAADVLSLITGIADKYPASAEFCRQTISRVYKYGIRTLRAPKGFNPAEAVKGAVIVPPKKNRPKLGPKDLPALLSSLDAHDGPEQVKIGVQLLLHTWVRKEELAGARWEEIDLETATWTIPATRMKMRREHVVPLVPGVVEKFKQLRELSGESAFVFPSSRRNKRASQPMHGATFNYTLNKIGYAKRFGPHGVRATAATIMAEAGWDARIINAQLAHAPKDAVEAAYIRATYLEQRRLLLSAWSQMLEGFAAGANVIPINKGRAA